MPTRIITLTTDFGTSDHFVGVMKGVIFSICPAAEIVDVSHEIHPFEISEGAFVISQAWRYFPKRTIHVVVVDPGVGTSRRPILVQAGGQYFIGPDNGVLSLVYNKEKAKVREITAEKFVPDPFARTPAAVRSAKKKYQFTHPIAARPATMTSQSVADISILRYW